ncbi:MAG: hypothetical protein ACE5EO_04870 [Candidatus Krumholzibacteriia bacterium]
MAFTKLIHTLYTVAITFIVVMFLIGAPYYSTPITERPHASLHQLLKPSGSWGHGVGIIGSAMVLALFLYSARKRHVMGLRWGTLPRWLSVHIFFGIVGPLLITLHTAMKFHGFVSISYFSMVAVVLSGVFGRYIYMQIPRDTRGHVLAIEDIGEAETVIGQKLESELQMPPDILDRVSALSNLDAADEYSSAKRVIIRAIFHDLGLPFRARRLRRYIRLRRREIPDELLDEVVALAKEKSVLHRRIAFLNSMNRALHYWHVIHKPFAYVMVIIMIAHIVVAVSLGYTWIF